MLTDLFIIGIFKLLFVEQFVRRAWLRICLFFFGVSDSGSSHCHHVIFLLAAKSQVVLPHTFKNDLTGQEKISKNIFL